MPKRAATHRQDLSSGTTTDAAHMDDAQVSSIVSEILNFPDARTDARTRHFTHLYDAFATQYPALMAIACSAGPPDGPGAANVRRMLGMMLAHRASGIRDADTPDNAASLAVRGTLMRHYVVPVLEAASNAGTLPTPPPPPHPS